MGRLPVFFPPAEGVQFASGSYVGAGKSGAGNENKLSFSFEPKLVLIAAYDGAIISFPVAFAAGVNTVITENAATLIKYALEVEWTVNTLKWRLSSASNQSLAERAQLNNQGTVYHWFAFG